MSYILDALRKAAEQRGSTASVLFRPAPTQVGVSRSWRVPGIVVGALLVVNVAVLVWVFRPVSGPDLPPTASESSAAPAVTLAPPPAIHPSESAGAPAPHAAVPTPAPTPGLADLRPPPHAAAVRATPKTAPPAATARPSAATRAIPAEPPAVAPVQPSAPPLVESPAPPRTRAERRAAAVAEPTTQPTREATASSPSTPKPPSGNRGALKLEVISFSDTPAQRLVFISGRKYVEGDTIEGGFRIEQIKEDSVVLSDQGVRFTLR